MAKKYNISKLAKFCDGSIVQHGNDIPIQYLATDSRKVIFAKNTVFFALVTSRNDGHKYIDELYSKGVRNFVVSEEVPLHLGANFIQVNNTLDALQQVAKNHRNQFIFPVIAITGSNGKTIVKEWLYQLVHQNYNVVRSPKSYNSQIGVPFSLWNMDSQHELAIIEAGISEKGEMVRLEEQIDPNWGIITNIGDAHSEGFDSKQQKLEEKISLFKNCDKVFYAQKHQQIAQSLQAELENVLFISWSEDDRGKFSHVKVESDVNSSIITGIYLGTELRLTIPFTDKASIENALLSILVALELGVAIHELQQRLDRLYPIDLRLDMINGLNGTRIIQDFYNSDPESVRIALDFLTHQQTKGKTIVVLSDFDQIKEEEEVYKSMVEVLNQAHIDHLLLLGKAWKKYTSEFKTEVFWYANTATLFNDIHNRIDHDALILLKGARKYHFEDISQRLQEQLHITFMEVNLGALVNNLNVYKSFLNNQTKIMAMVKASSYGAGTAEIASVMQFNRVDYLGVAYLEEGVQLRKSGITLPIMVMNAEPSGFERLIKYQLEPEVYSPSFLKKFNNALSRFGYEGGDFPIHIKLETGMQRLGFSHDQLQKLTSVLKENPHLKVASVFSHLAAADDDKANDFSHMQVQRFNAMADEIEGALNYKPLRHVLNSSGVIRFSEYHMDMVRLGIGLYGVDPVGEVSSQLRPVSILHTSVSMVKKVEKGESVGYSRSFIAKQDIMLATIPIGYADGLFRSLYKKGQVYIKGEKRPVVGKICMDMCMVDVTGLNVKEGDSVEIFGSNITLEEIAEWADTIPYEILVRVGQRVPRVYIEE